MLNGIGSFTLAGVLGLLMQTGVACASQATPPVAEPSPVQSLVNSERLAATPTRPTKPESTAPVQEDSEPTTHVSAAATDKAIADVEFFMTEALDALSDPPWSSELLQVALQMSRSGNTAYIPLIIGFLRLQFSQQGRAEQGSYLTSLAGEQYEDIPGEDGDWGLWIEWLGKHPEVRPPPG